jgi:hypothetical protein
VDKSGVIDRILALRALDGQGPRALDACLKAITGDTRDPDGAVRYWAVVALHQGYHKPLPEVPNLREGSGESSPLSPARLLALMRDALKDDSVAVRVAAAHALCDWGEEAAGLPVLVGILEKHPLASGRHFAATALEHLGEKARPALPAIESAAKADGYAARTCRNLLARLAK